MAKGEQDEQKKNKLLENVLTFITMEIDWKSPLKSLSSIFIAGFLILLFLKLLFIWPLSGIVNVKKLKLGEFSLEMSENNDQTKYSQILLPASECFFDTKIIIGKDESVGFSASGSAHLDMVGLIKKINDTNFSNDFESYIFYPKGLPWDSIANGNKNYASRNKLLIDTTKNVGAILAVFVPELFCQDLDDKERLEKLLLDYKAERFKSKEERKIKTINIAGNEPLKTYSNPCKEKARLYLVVNDVLFDFKHQDYLSYEAYKEVFTSISIGEDSLKKQYLIIKNQKNADNVWFKDNLGNYLVTIERSK